MLKELISRLDSTSKIDQALNGMEALKLIEEMSAQFDRRDHYDLILMDLHMPILDGFKTA